MFNKKDSIVSALKMSISNALIGLEGEGLTIIQKNGMSETKIKKIVQMTTN